MFIGTDAIQTFKLTLKHDLTIIQDENEANLTCFEIEEDKQIEKCNLDHIEDSRRNLLQQKLIQNSKIFSKTKYDIGKTKIDECKIKLINEDLITVQKPYRTNIVDQRRIEEIIDQLIENKLIEESYSPFSAPVALVNKKDDGDKSRLVVNYKKLNDNVVTDSYPFPRIEDIIDKTLDCRYFTTLDVNSAFWTVQVRPEDRHKLAFVTTNGHFQWCVMPFGFKNALAVFQRILSSALKKHKLTLFCSNYMDDILIKLFMQFPLLG